RSAARHPWRVIGAWIAAIVVAVVLVGGFLGDTLTTDGHVTNDPESLRAYDLMGERDGRPDGPDDFVVLRSESAQANDAAFKARVASLTGALGGAIGAQNIGLNAVSRDEHAVLLPLDIADDKVMEDVIAAVESANGGGFTATVTGETTLDHDFGVISERDLQEG